MRIVLFFFVLCFCTGTGWAHSDETSGLVRVGIFPLEPINFIDEQGAARGLYPDLLRKIVVEEGWSLEFVPGTWAQGLERLQAGEIDLMTTIAYTPKRAEVMDYNHEGVVTIWGQVFLLPDSGIEMISDLEGLTVAITEKDISGENFVKTLESFGVAADIQSYPRHEDVFEALEKNEVDAAVAPNHFGLRHASEYGLVPSSIQFSPFSIYFATKKGHFSHLLQHIDKHLVSWKADRNSYYYQRLNYWMGSQGYEKEIVPLWVLVSLGVVLLAALVFFFSSLVFKSQVRKATAELREREREYRKLVQSINSIVLRVDTRGIIQFMNRYGLDFFGFEKNEIIGRNVLETIVPEAEADGRVLKPIIEEILAHPDGFETVENENVCKDGRRVFIQWQNQPEFDERGELIGAFSVGVDITDRQRVEKELRAKEQKFRTLFEHIVDYALVLRPEGDDLRIVDMNEAACRFHGYSREELIGQPITFLDVQDVPVDGERMQRIVSGEIVHFEVVHRRKDGSTFPAEVAVKMIEIDGKPTILSIERDLTRRKQADAEKADLERTLRQKFKMEAIGTLAGGIAHDFNNVLAIILGSAELLRRKHIAEENSLKKIDRILTAADRAKNLVGQVLAFSRKQQQSFEPVAMDELLSETVDLLRATIPRTVAIKSYVAPAPERFNLLADRVQMQQVLINLCNNAVDAMQEKGVVSISLKPAPVSLIDLMEDNANPAGYLLLSVEDNGPGISASEIEKIFDPFYTTKDVGQGTGMGLAVVHGIVRGHRGMIHVESQLGSGSCFKVLLPRVGGSSAPVTDSEDAVLTGSGRILFVDDEADLTLWAEEFLTQQGFSTTVCSSSSEAFDLFSKDPQAYDLLVTDQSMPDMSGLELIGEVRKKRPEMPVVICSGFSNRVSEDVVTQRQISGYLQKPYRGAQLVHAINLCLQPTPGKDSPSD